MQRAHENLVDASTYPAVDSDEFLNFAVDWLDDHDPNFFNTIQSPSTSPCKGIPTRQTNPLAAPGSGFTDSEVWQFIDERPSNEFLPLQMTQTEDTEIASLRGRACTACRVSKVALSIANDKN